MLASPNIEINSQLLNLKKSIKYGYLSLKTYIAYFMQEIAELCWELGLDFCLSQLSTQV